LGAATEAPAEPPSTKAQKATSPRKPMNQALVWRTSPLPNSEVPVLPNTSPGTPSKAPPAVPSMVTCRIIVRR
jgi:hypothetical protein